MKIHYKLINSSADEQLSTADPMHENSKFWIYAIGIKIRKRDKEIIFKKNYSPRYDIFLSKKEAEEFYQ